MRIKTSLLSFILVTVLMSSCTKTEIRYVEVSSPSTTSATSAAITSTTVVSFSNDLRMAAASCLESMPEFQFWDLPTWSPELERNVEACREFRILGLAEKTDSKVLEALTLDLDEHLSTVEYIISWGDQCDRAAELADPSSSVEYSNCGLMGIVAESDSSVKRSRALRISQNLQALLSQ
jgi:hypothetical protein